MKQYTLLELLKHTPHSTYSQVYAFEVNATGQENLRTGKKSFSFATMCGLNFCQKRYSISNGVTQGN